MASLVLLLNVLLASLLILLNALLNVVLLLLELELLAIVLHYISHVVHQCLDALAALLGLFLSLLFLL